MSTTPQAYNGTAYELTGPDGAPAVVFIHGLGLCREVFDDVLPAFAGYRVLTYDLYGHGASKMGLQTASLSVYAQQLAGLVAHLGLGAVHVVGFSIGGMINRRFALDYPHLVKSLTILNSPHDRGVDAQAAVEARALSARQQGAFATFDAAVARWFTPEFLAQGGGASLVRKWRELVDDESYAQASWVLANGVVELTGRDGQITSPTLVMTCENDVGSTPQMSCDIAAEIPGAQTIIIPNFKHLGIIEAPASFTAPVLAFLAGID